MQAGHDDELRARCRAGFGVWSAWAIQATSPHHFNRVPGDTQIAEGRKLSGETWAYGIGVLTPASVTIQGFNTKTRNQIDISCRIQKIHRTGVVALHGYMEGSAGL